MPRRRRLLPEDLPILLSDDQNRLTAGLKLERQEIANNELRLIGWSLGAAGLVLLRDGKLIESEVRRMPRNDVLQAYSATSEFDPGYELVVRNPQSGNYVLRWELLEDGQWVPVDFELTITVPKDGSSIGSNPLSAPTMADVTLLTQRTSEQPIRHHIDCALSIQGGLVLIGWLDDRLVPVPIIFVQTSTSSWKGFPLSNSGNSVQCMRTYRPDVLKALNDGKSNSGQLGIVAWVPFDAADANDISISFDKNLHSLQSLRLTTLIGDTSVVERTLIQSALALRTIAERQRDAELLSWLDDRDLEAFEKQAEKIAAIDHVFLAFGKALLLHGWIASDSRDIVKVELVAGNVKIDIKDRLVRISRPDLFHTFPWLKPCALGFVVLIDEPEFIGCSQIKLYVSTRTNRSKLQAAPDVADWSVLLNLMNGNPSLAEPITQLISASASVSSIPGFKDRLPELVRAHFLAHQKNLSVHVDNPTTAIVAIDRAFALGEGGILVFGWRYEPEVPAQQISVHAPDGQSCDITQNFVSLARLDVSQNLRKRFPDVTDMCGFVCHVPISTRVGEPRSMCFRFGERGNVWVKLVTTAEDPNPVQLIKTILGIVPAPDKIRGSLYELFDKALGRPIEFINTTRLTLVKRIFQRQFGSSPLSPSVSVIVPLYGRYDFLRHQLAHFVDDPDFDNVDLIYVVDDPTILAPALDMGAAHYQLFCKPFRLVWYEKNLGFAGANNIGASVSRADTLLLLNSDILPKAKGWLSILRSALDELPNAGAVGPLLQFSDDSVQHAGMRAKSDPFFPGFLLNVHPGKGIAWTKTDEPSQHPMLTAACLMLRKADYDAVGGLDEGYIIGDFEDSDLCLKLRKRGQSLWLVPAAKLWHLERQSQNLGTIAGYRQLLTLFNGWRYYQKILNGEIANPEESAF